MYIKWDICIGYNVHNNYVEQTIAEIVFNLDLSDLIITIMWLH